MSFATSTSGIHERLADAGRANNGDVLVKLDTTQSAQLASLENRIEQGLASFIEVGEALSAIRESRLYRATHSTFEEYCREKWQMSASRARQLLGAAEVAKSVTIVTLTTESQARELSRVEPARRVEVIERAQATTGGKITAAAIKEAAVEIVVMPAKRRSPVRFDNQEWRKHTRTVLLARMRDVPNDKRADAVELIHRVADEIPVEIVLPVKREQFVMPNRGLFIARGAIGALEEILIPDGERLAALKSVRDWCNRQLRGGAEA